MQNHKSQIIYPPRAKSVGIGGKVILQFVIDTMGFVTDIKIIQGVNMDIDFEAIRVVRMLNGWKPATLNGRKVKFQYKLPITFHPNKSWKDE